MKRLVAAVAALLCATAIAASAHAMHVSDGLARQRLCIAAAFAFGHGLALLLLRSREGRLVQAAQACLLAGVLLFAGSLAGAALASWPTRFAPHGGTLLILGWLLAAIDFLRKD